MQIASEKKQETEIVFDVEKIRNDFPILQTMVHGQPLIYLDNAATTQKPKNVIKAISDYYGESNANVHRALHYLSDKATDGYENSRKKVATFINAASAEEIIFTRGTTESINLVAHSWAEINLVSGDEIILSEMEHHSNIVPWHLLAERLAIKIKYIPVLDDGSLDLVAFQDLITSKTKLLAIAHMSNVLGTINPVKQLTQIAHNNNIKVLVDAAQSVPNIPVDVTDIDCDFFAFSSHKMIGPTGLGVLYVKKHNYNEMRPFLGGGEMIATVEKTGSTWADAPYKFEAGTPNIAGAFGLSEAIDYLSNLGMENIAKYKKRLTHYALDGMKRVPGIKVFGDVENRGGAISFVIDGVHPFDLAQFLDQQGIAIRAGHHCTQILMSRFNQQATSRASLYFYNTFHEVDTFIEKLHKAVNFF